jgi:hypothetical protein
VQRDAEQKERMAERLWQLGFFPQFNALAYTPRAVEDIPREITDLDVLATRLSDTGRIERAVVDCKTGNASPINRALWLSGLMNHRQIHVGYVVSRRDIPEDHRRSALEWGVHCLAEAEINEYFRIACGVESQELQCLRLERWDALWKNLPSKTPLKNILQYSKYYYWGDSPERRIRYCLMEARACRKTLKVSQLLHRVFVCDLAALFSLALLEMLASTLPVYQVEDDKEKLDNMLRAQLYGGREVYMYMARLREVAMSILQQKDADLYSASEQADGGLALPEWSTFLSLYRAISEHPRSYRDVPRLLRLIAIDSMLAKEEIDPHLAIARADLRTYQFASDCAEYFCTAAQLESGFSEEIKGLCDDLLVKASKVGETG